MYYELVQKEIEMVCNRFLFLVQYVNSKKKGFVWAAPPHRKYVAHTDNLYEMPAILRRFPSDLIPPEMFHPSESDSDYYPRPRHPREITTDSLIGYTSYSSDDGFYL